MHDPSRHTPGCSQPYMHVANLPNFRYNPMQTKQQNPKEIASLVVLVGAPSIILQPQCPFLCHVTNLMHRIPRCRLLFFHVTNLVACCCLVVWTTSERTRVASRHDLSSFELASNEPANAAPTGRSRTDRKTPKPPASARLRSATLPTSIPWMLISRCYSIASVAVQLHRCCLPSLPRRIHQHLGRTLRFM